VHQVLEPPTGGPLGRPQLVEVDTTPPRLHKRMMPKTRALGRSRLCLPGSPLHRLGLIARQDVADLGSEHGVQLIQDSPQSHLVLILGEASLQASDDLPLWFGSVHLPSMPKHRTLGAQSIRRHRRRPCWPSDARSRSWTVSPSFRLGT